jgi:hypothetical protein
MVYEKANDDMNITSQKILHSVFRRSTDEFL